MPQRRIKYKFNVRRLIISLAVIIGLIIGFITVVGGGEQQQVVLYEPAAAPCYTGCGAGGKVVRYRFPLGGEQQRAFSTNTPRVPDGAYLYDLSYYKSIAGKRISFQAYIRPEAFGVDDADRYDKDGITYIAANYVPWGEGATAQRMISSVDGAPEEERVLLGFHEGSVPTDSERFLEVHGYVSDVSTSINPNGASAYIRPVVMVGSWSSLSAAEVIEPATAIATPPFATRRGDVTIAVKGVDFAPSQTRVKLSLLYEGVGSGQYGTEDVRIVQGKGVPLDQELPDDIPIDENSQLGGTDLVPNQPRPITLFFPGIPSPRTSALQLKLPDPTGVDEDSISLRLEPREIPRIPG